MTHCFNCKSLVDEARNILSVMRTYCLLPVLMLAFQTQLVLGLSPLPAPTNVCPVAKCLPPDPNNPCRNECSRDGQCGAGGKCCRLCGCNRCFGGATRRPPRETCDTLQCPSGQVCVERPCKAIDCPRARCVRQPVQSEKPGTCKIAAVSCLALQGTPKCPRNQCSRDSQCRGTQKCCPASDCSGCQRCEEPLENQNRVTCALLDCASGYICVEDPEARCVKRNSKSGLCPRPSGLVGTCDFRPGVNCLSDSECPGEKKCCSEGCGSICKQPIFVN